LGATINIVDGQTGDAVTDADNLLAANWDIVSNTPSATPLPAANLEDYRISKGMEYASVNFVPTPVGPVIAEIPADFCPAEVYTAQQDAMDAVAGL
jgi:hypothetical protein